MLLKKLTANNPRSNDSLELPLDDISAGFIVKDIEGLGPVKATLSSSASSNFDGAYFHTSRREPRNIIIKLGLDPNYSTTSVFSLRSQIYNVFMPKTEVKLEFSLFNHFTNEYLDLEISGRIETCDPSIFEKEPSVDVSIMCFEPDFIDPNEVEITGTAVSSANDHLTFDWYYEGTVETGFFLSIEGTGGSHGNNGFAIRKELPGGVIQSMSYFPNFPDGDFLELSTVDGDKFARIADVNDDTTSILYDLEVSHEWIKLYSGINVMTVRTSGGGHPFIVKYNNRYGGL